MMRPSMDLMPAPRSAVTQLENTAAPTPVPGIDRRIAPAANEQIAAQDALLHRSGCLERGGHPGIPTQNFRRSRQREDFHVRRRHHQLVGVQREELLVLVDGSDVNRPLGVRHDWRTEDGSELAAELFDIFIYGWRRTGRRVCGTSRCQAQAQRVRGRREAQG